MCTIFAKAAQLEQISLQLRSYFKGVILDEIQNLGTCFSWLLYTLKETALKLFSRPSFWTKFRISVVAFRGSSTP